MKTQIDPDVASNYDALVAAGSHTYEGIAEMADSQNSPTLAKWARERKGEEHKKAGKDRADAAKRGERTEPNGRQTRSKGKGKEVDGEEEPPESIDKVTPGTRFPIPQQGDQLPTSVAPDDENTHEVSQTPSTVVDQIARHPDRPAPLNLSSGNVKAAPTEIDPELNADAAQPQVLPEPVDPSDDSSGD